MLTNSSSTHCLSACMTGADLCRHNCIAVSSDSVSSWLALSFAARRDFPPHRIHHAEGVLRPECGRTEARSLFSLLMRLARQCRKQPNAAASAHCKLVVVRAARPRLWRQFALAFPRIRVRRDQRALASSLCALDLSAVDTDRTARGLKHDSTTITPRTSAACMVAAFAAPMMTPSYCAARASQSMDFSLGAAVAASIGVATGARIG